MDGAMISTTVTSATKDAFQALMKQSAMKDQNNLNNDLLSAINDSAWLLKHVKSRIMDELGEKLDLLFQSYYNDNAQSSFHRISLRKIYGLTSSNTSSHIQKLDGNDEHV